MLRQVFVESSFLKALLKKSILLNGTLSNKNHNLT